MGTAPNGYNTPKTNWAAGDVPTASDFNRIEGNIQAIQTDFAAHLANNMPHRATDPSTGKVYRWGLAIQNGEWGILVEEVV